MFPLQLTFASRDSLSFFTRSNYSTQSVDTAVITKKTKFCYLEISRKLSRYLRKTEEIISLSQENGGNKMHECMAV